VRRDGDRVGVGRTGSYSSNSGGGGGRHGERYDDRDRDRDWDRDRTRERERERDRISAGGGQSAYRPDRNSSASWSAPPGPQSAERDALWPMFRAVDKDSKSLNSVRK